MPSTVGGGIRLLVSDRVLPNPYKKYSSVCSADGTLIDQRPPLGTCGSASSTVLGLSIDDESLPVVTYESLIQKQRRVPTQRCSWRPNTKK